MGRENDPLKPEIRELVDRALNRARSEPDFGRRLAGYLRGVASSERDPEARAYLLALSRDAA
jgi:hypothetical protein